MKTILIALFFLAGSILIAVEAPSNATGETVKIEALLAYIGSQANVKFIRNGSEYDNATAAKFLRKKWERQRAEINTARDFIEKVASRSSTTGQVYRIHLADGKEIDCSAFLLTRLAEMEKPELAKVP